MVVPPTDENPLSASASSVRSRLGTFPDSGGGQAALLLLLWVGVDAKSCRRFRPSANCCAAKRRTRCSQDESLLMITDHRTGAPLHVELRPMLLST